MAQVKLYNIFGEKRFEELKKRLKKGAFDYVFSIEWNIYDSNGNLINRIGKNPILNPNSGIMRKIDENIIYIPTDYIFIDLNTGYITLNIPESFYSQYITENNLQICITYWNTTKTYKKSRGVSTIITRFNF